MTKITRSILTCFLTCFLTALASTAFADNISGTYVGLYSNAAELLQIVARPDGSILGRFEEVSLVSDGTKIDQMNDSVTGAVSGNTIVLTLKSPEFLGGTTPMSGTIRGDTIQLSGGSDGNSFSLVVKRSTESVFTQQVQGLTAQANRTAAIDAAQKSLARTQKTIEHVAQWMLDYSKSAAVHLQRLPKVPAAYAAITGKMQVALDRETSEPPHSVARSQTDVWIIQAGVEFDQGHFQLQSIESSFGYSNGTIDNDDTAHSIAETQAYCGGVAHAEESICKNFAAAYSSYQFTVRQLEQDFATVENTWQSEHEKQKAIQKQADSISQ